MNTVDFILIAGLVLVIVLAMKKVLRDRKNGRSCCGSGSDCSSCGCGCGGSGLKKNSSGGK